MKTTGLKEIKVDNDLIAYCGLYCSSCGSYLKGKCPGCRENMKASWCRIRECCIENNYKSCADCDKDELADCKKYNNFFSKVIGLILNSDRSACIRRIKEIGYDAFAMEMAENRWQTIKRK
ncbi:MAG TPA: DUF3795 domain-containing protein [Bacteroidales bacterium]|jgi:hypothetical protein|nr:DUF3795 domain-containing protein [Bacteroidales bacterium]